MIAVGLMSGTSADGVSAATIRVERRLKLLAYRTFPYPRLLRERVLAAKDLRAPGLSPSDGELLGREAAGGTLVGDDGPHAGSRLSRRPRAVNRQLRP